MTTNIDFSQYRRTQPQKENSTSSNPQQVDFSQYKRQSENATDQQMPSQDNRSVVEQYADKGTRLATQGLLGAIQNKTIGYDIPAIYSREVSIKNAPQEFRENNFSDIERLQEQKAAGQWDKQDQEQYDHLVDLIKNPRKAKEFLPKDEDIPHYDVGSLIEKGAKQFGVDLEPKDTSELAARWIGFIKDPKKAVNLMKNGFNPGNAKEVIKALAPTGKEVLRGAGAASAIQYASEAEWGPIGTMLAAIGGDLAPSLGLKAAKNAIEFGKNPAKNSKKLAAKTVASFTPRDKVELQQSIIKDFREAGIQADAGTITGSNIVKWVNSTLHNSGLTGEPLEQFKNSITKNIVKEYKKVTEQLGESIHSSKYEAGEALKNGLREARDLDLSEARSIYESASERAGGKQVFAGNIAQLAEELERKLSPGSVKSADQKAVLTVIDQLKKDILGSPDKYEYSVNGSRGVSIRSLINNKIGLGEIIDFEAQEGAKKLLKRLRSEIDKTIASHGADDPKFAQEWRIANNKYAKHAKLFRGKVISEALKTQDPAAVLNKMNTPHGILEIKNALSKTPEGRELFKQLSANKMEEMIGKNMVDGITNQLNLGKFSKLLENGQNRQIAEILLGKDGVQRLERIQKASGRLAESAQKFFNASRSGYYVADLAAAAKIVNDIINLFAGNPWPLAKSGGTLMASRKVAKQLADPEFLRMVEDIILESKRGSETNLQNLGVKLAKKAASLEKPAAAALQTTPRQ